MRWSAELSDEAQKQLARFPRNVRDRIERAIDEFEENGQELKSGVLPETGPIRSGMAPGCN
jgi:mRNA-degrading endonuclease RelE of RelBE toxin-antitoxin system